MQVADGVYLLCQLRRLRRQLAGHIASGSGCCSCVYGNCTVGRAAPAAGVGGPGASPVQGRSRELCAACHAISFTAVVDEELPVIMCLMRVHHSKSRDPSGNQNAYVRGMRKRRVNLRIVMSTQH
jgi:hypothetical protein